MSTLHSIPHFTKLEKIMIIGRPGSGKSTFSIQLKKILNLPLFHLDKYFFEENWKERNYQDFLSIQQEMVNSARWVIDGNSTKSYEMRFAQADVCLYFNFPRWLCYWRVLKRLFHKHSEINDRALGCHETVRWSLLSYMWNFEGRVKPILNHLKSKYPNVHLIELRADQDIRNLTSHLITAISRD